MPQHDVLAQIRVQFGATSASTRPRARSASSSTPRGPTTGRSAKSQPSWASSAARATPRRRAFARRSGANRRTPTPTSTSGTGCRSSPEARRSCWRSSRRADREAVRLARRTRTHTSLACLLDELGKHDADSETSHREAIRLDQVRGRPLRPRLLVGQAREGRRRRGELPRGDPARPEGRARPLGSHDPLLEKRDDVDGAISVEVRGVHPQGRTPPLRRRSAPRRAPREKARREPVQARAARRSGHRARARRRRRHPRRRAFMMRLVSAGEAIEVEHTARNSLKVVGGHHTLGYTLDNWHGKAEDGNRQHFSTWEEHHAAMRRSTPPAGHDLAAGRGAPRPRLARRHRASCRARRRADDLRDGRRRRRADACFHRAGGRIRADGAPASTSWTFLSPAASSCSRSRRTTAAIGCSSVACS